jgi:response regulator RpfG family c-di-GMP phosphodiesterase
MDRLKVLCVDDEINVLEGLALHLQRTYDMTIATSGQEGLEALAKKGPFAVVMSDMRMPMMDGATFLGRVRELAPDTTRMLFTGYTDVNAAIEAVNKGQIFRFLTKPCPPAELRMAFDAAVKQYQLVTSERVLLEQTLRGAIKALIDILALTSPLAFGRAGRVRQYVCALANELHLENRWQVEVAAMLSQLGSIAVPEDILMKYYSGETLSAKEREIINRITTVTDSFLANIPRLEPVREILAKHVTPFVKTGGGQVVKNEITVAASILRVAVAYDELESHGLSTQKALEALRGRKREYDPAIVELLAQVLSTVVDERVVRDVPLRALGVGMVLGEDLRTKTGLLIVSRGFEVTTGFLEKTRNFANGFVQEPIRVTVKTRKEIEEERS